MRLLVTGGNGYVGRTLTRQLYQNHEVAVLDNLSRAGNRFRGDELSRFELYQEDIRDGAAVKRVVAKVRPDVVIHLAAIHFIPECESNPDDAIATNTLGTVNLLRACPAEMRFIFASTAAVYAPDQIPHVEDLTSVGPMDIYGLTKWHAEQYVHHWVKHFELKAKIVRLFNVIGPGETNPHILPAILAQVMKGARTLRLGNCHPKRDYIHVSDVSDAFRALALTDNWSQRIDTVNVGTGNSYSVYELVEALARAIGSSLRIESDASRIRASDRPFLGANIDKILKNYGWTPRHTLASAMNDLWSNPDIPSVLLERS